MDKSRVGGVPLVSSVTTDALRDRAQPSLQFVEGREYVAEVVSFADGQIVMVRIQDNLLNMKLGNNLSPGQLISLKFVTSHPVPTFTLVQSEISESLSGYVALSLAGTIIGQYLQENEKIRTYDQAVSTKIPLLSTPWLVEQSAKELQQSIIQSGFFYESHLANYARGKNTIEHLLQEPQNQADFNTSEMVAKQLEIIEKNTIKWSGSVWPEQLMSWTTHLVSDHLDNNQHQESTPAPDNLPIEINSQIELTLPNLKSISANFTLAGGTLSLSLKVKDSNTLILMQSELGLLIAALTLSGQKLGYCTVKLHE